MTTAGKVWYGETLDTPTGPGRVVAVVIAKDEPEATELALDMVGRHGRSLLSEHVSRISWEVLGTAHGDSEIVTGYWVK
jgi:hypothetical protein